MDSSRFPDLDRLTDAVKDTFTVRRVFGEPIENDGSLVIPVARLSGGSGIGFGSGTSKASDDEDGDSSADTGPETGEGGGGGFGVTAKAEGVYVIRDGNARWEPALDVNRLAVGGMLLGAVSIIAWLITSGRQRG